MLTQLQVFVDQGGCRPNSINLGTVLSRLPPVSGSEEVKLSVVSKVGSDLDDQIRAGFLHPVKGTVDTRALVSVAWGLQQLGLGAQQHCR